MPPSFEPFRWKCSDYNFLALNLHMGTVLSSSNLAISRHSDHCHFHLPSFSALFGHLLFLLASFGIFWPFELACPRRLRRNMYGIDVEAALGAHERLGSRPEGGDAGQETSPTGTGRIKGDALQSPSRWEQNSYELKIFQSM